MNDRSQFEEALTLIPARLTLQQMEMLERYVGLLEDWNRKINLISRKESGHIWLRHILPSITPLFLTSIAAGSGLLDMGSGGGLPAIPLKILRPDLKIVMVESIRKKALFLKEVVRELNLRNAAVYNERLENLAMDKNLARRFQWVTARAVSGIPRLLEWSAPFLQNEGKMLLWKGKSDIAELEKVCLVSPVRCEILRPPGKLCERYEKMRETCWFLVSYQKKK